MRIQIFTLFIAIFGLFVIDSYGQVSINADGTSPDRSAMLDVKSNDKGILIPRMTTDQRTAIQNPAAGLLVYDTDYQSFWYVQDTTGSRSGWIEIITVNDGWSLTGNAGTDPSESFIGTTDSTSLIIRVNSRISGLIEPTVMANTGYGYRSLEENTTGVGNTANGYQALYLNTEGDFNTAVGRAANHSNTSGNSNTVIGNDADYYNQTGSNNTIIGAEAGKGTALHNKSGNVFIGNKAGYDETGSNKLYIENSNSATPLIGGDFADDEVYLNGKVGIGTNNPDPSAILEINTTTSGFLPPRLTQTQILAIQDPANGLVVFCTSDDKFYSYIDAANAWKEISFGAGILEPPYVCGTPITKNHVAGTVAPVTKTVTYNSISNIPGEPSKCWLTSNLGADNPPTAHNDNSEAAAGWYWQFNHMQGYKHTGIARTPNTIWITSINESSDWLACYDPCSLEMGGAWRIPTYTEWYNVDSYGGWNDWIQAFNSDLGLHAAGYLNSSTGSLGSRGSEGYYWSSTKYDDANGWNLSFSQYSSYMSMGSKAYGFSVRCVR